MVAIVLCVLSAILVGVVLALYKPFSATDLLLLAIWLLLFAPIAQGWLHG